MGKTMLGVFFGLIMVLAGASAALAHQAGGVEVGDLETGSVVGQKGMNLKGEAGPVIVRYDAAALAALASKFENYRMSSAIRHPYSH